MKPYSEIIDHVRQLAADNPDQTAECAYFDISTGMPLCIFGHVIYELGAVQKLSGNNYYIETGDGKVVLDYSHESVGLIEWDHLGVDAPTERQRRWSAVVQDRQDCGLSGRESVEYADAEENVDGSIG